MQGTAINHSKSGKGASRMQTSFQSSINLTQIRILSPGFDSIRFPAAASTTAESDDAGERPGIAEKGLGF